MFQLPTAWVSPVILLQGKLANARSFVFHTQLIQLSGFSDDLDPFTSKAKAAVPTGNESPVVNRQETQQSMIYIEVGKDRS